jgi:acetylornithine/N-succinyldiaminopimelate aminotransferase
VLANPYQGRSGDLMEIARKHGVLVLQAGPDVVRFLPPLTITADDLAEGLTRLASAIAEFVSNT